MDRQAIEKMTEEQQVNILLGLKTEQEQKDTEANTVKASEEENN